MSKLTTILKEQFGFDRFRPGQAEIISSLLEGRDTLAILPTGGGKTLLYQFFAAVTHQRVVIVSPLISLMQDQVSRLQYLGTKRVVALTSANSFQERQLILRQLAQYQFIYASPEMLANPQIQERLSELKVGLLVIDEAHCISEWGPDFRPDYLKLNQVRKKLGSPLTLMATATATAEIRQDIIIRMGLQPSSVNQIVMPINRSNIFLSAKAFDNQKEKNQQLLALVAKLKGAGIVYFSSKTAAEEIADLITQKTDKQALAYHGGMDSETRFRIQQQFMNDEVEIICATSAFGMGIDKNDVRYIIHYHLPGSIQSYMQEIGRAGRDQQPALAILLYEPNDRYLQANLIDSTYLDAGTIAYLYQHSKQLNDNDAVRVINYYYEIGYSLEKTLATLSKVKQRRLSQLQEMVNYVQLTGCRREALLAAFDEELPVNSEQSQFCCDFHSNFWGHWQAFNEKYLSEVVKKSETARKGWHQTLDRLFLLKN